MALLQVLGLRPLTPRAGTLPATVAAAAQQAGQRRFDSLRQRLKAHLIFQHTLVDCPGCERTLDFELVVSVNAGRRPDLREAILNGSFQRERCPHCGVQFRVDPELTYIDLGRGQYICAWPVSKRRAWQQFAARSAFGWVRADGDRLGACLRAPRTLIAEIESDADAWRGLLDEVVDGPVVDFQRDMLSA